LSTLYIKYPQSSGGSGVSSLNSLTGNLTLVAGSGITITPAGSNITIASAGGTPGGANESIQFNNSGAFGGFGSWDGSLLTIPAVITQSSVQFNTNTISSNYAAT
jgi:hypothetical protein